MSSVYIITNLLDGKRYIGKTDLTVGERWKKHNSYSVSLKNRYITRAIRKYGKDNFSIKEIAANLTPEQANEAEKLFISEYDTFRNGYNLTEGGEGISGFRLTEEQRKNISETQKARWAKPEERAKQRLRKLGSATWNKGISNSPEARAKMSANSFLGNKTHCKNGHPLAGDNLYLRPKGGRACRACRKAVDIRQRMKKKNAR